jgi:hypothetical protein
MVHQRRRVAGNRALASRHPFGSGGQEVSELLTARQIHLSAEDTADLLRMAQGIAAAVAGPTPSEAMKRVNRKWIAGFQAMADAGPKVITLAEGPTRAQLRAQTREAAREADLRRAANVSYHASKRRTAKLQRTPRWADMDAIREFYAAARRMTEATGVVYHVDHIIPLQGRLVSGLHVPNNLQIIPGTENSRKRNRFEVE